MQRQSVGLRLFLGHHDSPELSPSLPCSEGHVWGQPLVLTEGHGSEAAPALARFTRLRRPHSRAVVHHAKEPHPEPLTPALPAGESSSP